MKRCEQPVPLSPGTGFPSLPLRPVAERLLQPAPHEAHRAAAERSDRQYLAITKYEFTFNNCGKHRRTRRVATGGESDEIRSRPRAPAPAFGINSDLLPLPRLHFLSLAQNDVHYYYRRCCCTLPDTPANANPPAFPSSLVHFCYTPWDKSNFPVLQ